MGADEHRVAVVIEDDADIRRLLAEVLAQGGFETHSAANGLEGVELVRAHRPTVTTLDVSMPGIDGFEAAKRIRAISDTYLIMLTARGDEIDTLMGLESGADDYLLKPFRPRELRARIDAMLRRRARERRADASVPIPAARYDRGVDATATRDVDDETAEVLATADAATESSPAEPNETDGWLEHRGLRLHPEMHLVTLDGDEIELTRSEFELLNLLMTTRRRVRSKADLALALRGESYVTSYYVSDADKRAVEVHMANLRRKLGESATQPQWIETVRGVGYRLTADEG
ncbi:response regulator transcription factor [Agromyces protaetiae]|uniref:Response regulator transcription factor n=1 Tax=Agromyces protaetiae TaxID=2509455 RepID=A0A4P6FVU4_9MICO|nr:response regulator transcription factor [Agromyces protaetiae]QAY74738.1 response regulator transcription factor [Agromyces protaetiae]